MPNSFIATALAISHTGARPVFVDVDPDTYLMDPARLDEAITPSTKAVIPVHLYGQLADMDPILEIARARGVAVIEDACQAHGARYRGRRAGCFGDAAAFSFYPAKNLGALGDGGMVVLRTTSTPERVQTPAQLRPGGKYRHDLQGFNRRLDTLQAALLSIKLRHLDGWSEARRERALLDDRLLVDVAVKTPVVADEREHVFHLYVVRTPERDELRHELEQRGISTQVHYPTAIHLQPAYAELGLPAGSFPVAEELAGQILSLPMYPELPLESVELACSELASASGQLTAPSV